MHSLPLITQLTQKARLDGLKSRQFQSRRARTSFFRGGAVFASSLVRRAPVRARRRGCCSAHTVAPHGRATGRVAGPAEGKFERRGDRATQSCQCQCRSACAICLKIPPLAGHYCTSYAYIGCAGLWPPLPLTSRPIAVRWRLIVGILSPSLFSTPPHPNCLSHLSLTAATLAMSQLCAAQMRGGGCPR